MGVQRFWAFPWDERTNETLIEEITKVVPELNTSLDNEKDDEFINGLFLLHKLRYIADIILNESDIVVELCKVEKIISLTEPPLDKLERKIFNLNKAFDYLFPKPLQSYQPIDKIFCLEGICKLHSMVMDGLIDNPGTYRVKEASPSGHFYFYKSSYKIESSLDSLCNSVLYLLGKDNNVKELVQIGGDFLGDFLDIHPFSNGNGRLGRLLLSYIMFRISIVPLPLNVHGNKPSREIYMNILEQARELSIPNYSTLQLMILEAVHVNVMYLKWLIT